MYIKFKRKQYDGDKLTVKDAKGLGMSEEEYFKLTGKTPKQPTKKVEKKEPEKEDEKPPEAKEEVKFNQHPKKK